MSKDLSKISPVNGFKCQSPDSIASQMTDLGTHIGDMLFSHYPKGYINKKGNAVLSVYPDVQPWIILDAYEYITSSRPKDATEGLGELVSKRVDVNHPTKAENDREQEFKKLNFEIATFSGVFNYRRATDLKTRNWFETIDIDHLGDKAEVERVKHLLTHDQWLVSALCFTSPRGDGLKDIVITPEAWRGLSHKEVYAEMRKHILFHYGIVIDESGSDVSRACYLPHDEKCYINQLLKKQQK